MLFYLLLPLEYGFSWQESFFFSSFLKNNIFKNVRIIFCIVFACVHVCAVPLEAKKCHLVPWNCSYREPVGQTLVLCQNSQSP